ncbi:MAG: hypothetical protein Q8904_14585 [Bacteroidota bacterium]|nr:hypothetical protein [Bacteroidota bacterium]
MKKIVNLSLSIIFSIIFFSCSQQDGGWDDNIKLSRKTVEFSAAADSVLVTTGGISWWVNNVSVDSNGCKYYPGVTAEVDTFTIQHDCFIVKRRNKNTLFIKVDKNTQSINRTITVCLEAGDYFDYVTVTQKPI